MTALNEIALDLLPAFMAVKRASILVDQAVNTLPKGRAEFALLIDAQNHLMAVALSLGGDPSFSRP